MRCEAMRKALYANDHADTDRQCQNQAQFVVNGQNLCRKHAAPIALDTLVKKGEIQSLSPCQMCGDNPVSTTLGSGKAQLQVCKECKTSVARELAQEPTS